MSPKKRWRFPAQFRNIRNKMNMGVSLNGGTSKSSILIGFSLINHPFWGTPIFGNTHIRRMGNQRWTRINGMSTTYYTSFHLKKLGFWEAENSPLWFKFICHPPSLSQINKASLRSQRSQNHKHHVFVSNSHLHLTTNFWQLPSRSVHRSMMW